MTTNYLALVAEHAFTVTAQQREMNRQLIDITYSRDLEAASNAQVLRYRELIEQELAEEAANAKDLSESEIAGIKAVNKRRNDAKNASAKKLKPQDLFASQPEEEDEVSFGVSTPPHGRARAWRKIG
eukprot:gene16020-22158_t